MDNKKSTPVSNYLSLVKFSHTIFAMPFALVGFLLAAKTEHSFSWRLLLLVVLCMVFARTAAMAFNRYIDRAFDGNNLRTKNREIPSGIISSRSALVFVIINCFLFSVTAFFINTTCCFLSPVALLIILGYSYTKRFTWLCHMVLGIGLALAPIGAYIAVSGRFDTLPLLLSFSVLFWVSGFDIIYALQDEEFDKSQKLQSIPVFLGKKNALLLSSVFHFLTTVLIVIFGITGSFGSWYWVGAGIFTGLLIYQHTLVKPNDLDKVNLAFFTTNGIASTLFAVFFILENCLK